MRSAGRDKARWHAWWWIERWRESAGYRELNMEQQALHRELLGMAQVRGGNLERG